MRYGFSMGWVVNMARDFPSYDTTPVVAAFSQFMASLSKYDSRSTLRVPCRMALSTISGPQTRVAPCFKAKRRVGTMQRLATSSRSLPGHTSTRTHHGCQEKAIFEILLCEMFDFGTFCGSRRRRSRQMTAGHVQKCRWSYESTIKHR